MASKSDNQARHIGDLVNECPSPQIPPGRLFVVAIGIDQYTHWPVLYNAVNDAVAIHELLVNKMGFLSPFPPLLNDNATKTAITALVNKAQWPELKEEDSLVLFFAGHGHTRVTQENGVRVEHGYLIPADAMTDQPDDYLSLDVFFQDISQLPARHILVILDACRSGMALGRDVVLSTSAGKAWAGSIDNSCRRVISSARWDQAARDSGPVQNQSLFTGFLLQGLDWGTADLFEDGEITATELGLFLQRCVGKEGECRQTPDFGVFRAGAQGDLTFSLQSGTYQAIKTRAYAALQRGMLNDFAELVKELAALRIDSPWTAFLNYRQALLEEGQVDAARQHVWQLRSYNLPRGTIPLSNSDVITLDVQLGHFRELLAVPQASDSPLDVRLQVGPDDARVWADEDESSLSTAWAEQPLGNVSGYEIPLGSITRFLVRNTGSDRVHIYFAVVRPDGRLVFGPLLHDPELALQGLEPELKRKGLRLR